MHAIACNVPFEVSRLEVREQWDRQCKPLSARAAEYAQNWHAPVLLALYKIHGCRPTAASAFKLSDADATDAEVDPVAAGVASNMERLGHILNVIEVLYSDARAPDIIAFLLNQAALPICRHMSPAALVANVAFREMRECVYTRQWIFAACWLVAGMYDSPRHFFFPERAPLRLRQDYPGALSWLRDMRQRSSSWYLVRNLFVGASSTKDFCGVGIKLGDNARKYTDGVHKPTLLHHALEVCRGRAHNSPMGTYGKLATFHGTTFEDMAREIYANLTGAYVFEVGTGVWDACPWYSQSPDGLVVRPDSVHHLQLPANVLDLTPDHISALCSTTDAGEDGPVPRRTSAPHLSALLEIKCQYLLNHAYDKCPDYYLNQLLQGLYVHGVTEAHFISMYYAPHHHGRYDDIDKVQITFEVLRANELIHQQYHYILREAGMLLSTTPDDADIVIPEALARSLDAFPDLLHEGLRRDHMTVHVRGLPYVAKRLSLSLEDALGSEERAEYWREVSRKAARATEATWTNMAAEDKDRWSGPATPEEKLAEAKERLELIRRRRTICPSYIPTSIARSETLWRGKLTDLQSRGAIDKFVVPASSVT